jgi:hypothetical protein
MWVPGATLGKTRRYIVTQLLEKEAVHAPGLEVPEGHRRFSRVRWGPILGLLAVAAVVTVWILMALDQDRTVVTPERLTTGVDYVSTPVPDGPPVATMGVTSLTRAAQSPFGYGPVNDGSIDYAETMRFYRSAGLEPPASP